MSHVLELFGVSTRLSKEPDWVAITTLQQCPFLQRKCIKVRKSQPEISIGSCTVEYGSPKGPVIICPFRLLERRQVFTDCLQLLTLHEPGNELHVVPEVSVPGGSVDYFLVSALNGKARDFVGIELQTLDTTGTVWPERERALKEKGVPHDAAAASSDKSFGMNWKMTAKTILVQLHHKVETFEQLNKHLVLAIQDRFLDYVKTQFTFGHITAARVGDPLHVHTYSAPAQYDGTIRIQLASRLSTDSHGIALSLGLQASPSLELSDILQQLQAKMSSSTLLTLG